jgi:hypothetical protein
MCTGYRDSNGRHGNLQVLHREIHEQTGRRWLWLEPAEMVARLNRLLGGWANYFCLGTVTAAYRAPTTERVGNTQGFPTLPRHLSTLPVFAL